MVQGELFREDSALSLEGSAFSRKKSFLSRFQFTLSLDKLLVGVIGLTIIFVLTYSFGVEHGKRTMEKHLQTMFPAVPETVPTQTQISTNSDNLIPAPEEKETVLLVGTMSPTEESVKAEVLPSLTPPVPTAQLTLPKVDTTKGKYTVQLVTYNNEKLAQQEIDRLRAKGQEGFIIPSGSHLQVCVNYFENRIKANSFLKQFRDSARYPDAYIRPVVR